MPYSVDSAPAELAVCIREFWPEDEWNNAAAISYLESGWSGFAENDTTDLEHPCGSFLYESNGVRFTAEHSVGYFQVNACNLPRDWKWYHLFNARHNAGTAHELWSRRGWRPWLLSSEKLGIA
jgi:hypothetical protein